MPFSM